MVSTTHRKGLRNLGQIARAERIFEGALLAIQHLDRLRTLRIVLVLRFAGCINPLGAARYWN